MNRLLSLLLLGTALSGVACGTKKPASSPDETDTTTGVPAEKWDTSSQTAEAAKEPAKTGTGAPKVHETASKKDSEYDKEATNVVLNRATRQVKDNCGFATDDTGKATGPWGKLDLKLLLGANGHMRTVTVPDPYAGKPVGRCVEKAFANLIFPPWSGEDTEVTWPAEVVKPEPKVEPKPAKK
jgi:hypothetical protein